MFNPFSNWKTKDSIIETVKGNGVLLQYESDVMRDDRDVVFAAVKQSGSALEFASPRLKDDMEVVIAALQRNGLALRFASERLRDSSQVVMAAIRVNGSSLKYASERLRNSSHNVIAAVTDDGTNLNYASERLKDDRDVVLQALKTSNHVLPYVSERLKDDREVVITAVKQNGFALQFVSNRLRYDRDFILDALQENISAYKHLPTIFKQDREVILVILKAGNIVFDLKSATDEIKDDEEIVRIIVKRNGNDLKHASSRLRDHRDLVQSVVSLNGHALRFASERLRNEKDLVLSAIIKHPFAIKHASDRLRSDKQFNIEAGKLNSQCFMVMSNELKRDKEFLLEAMKEVLPVLKYAAKSVLGDRGFIIECVKHDAAAFHFASAELQKDSEILFEAQLQKRFSALLNENKQLKDKVHQLQMYSTKKEREMSEMSLIAANQQFSVCNLMSESITESFLYTRSLSWIYQSTGVLHFHHNIANEPFHSIGDASVWQSLEDLQLAEQNNDRETVLVDLTTDESLQKHLSDVEMLLQGKNVIECFTNIALFVHSSMNEFNVSQCDKHIQEWKTKHHTNVIPIGAISIGSSRHRALLFKYLCDKMTTVERQLLCKLVRADFTSNHVWNIIYDPTDSKQYVVDLLQKPGALFAEESARSTEYKQLGGSSSLSPKSEASNISLRSFNRGKLLGRGAFGKVYSASLESGPEEYAMKVVELTDQEMQKALNEIELMTFVKHRNLIRLEHSFVNTKNGELIMIMKKMDMGGDDLIHKTTVLQDDIQLLSYLIQIARGVRYLHKHNIIHRDLKPQNTLVTLKQTKSLDSTATEVSKVKVADFGTSKILVNTMHAKTQSGTVQYCAPEIMFGSNYTCKVDTYSFGVMLGESAVNKRVTMENQRVKLLTRKEFVHKRREWLFPLYKRCTDLDYRSRPEFDEIVHELETMVLNLHQKQLHNFSSKMCQSDSQLTSGESLQLPQ